MAPLIPVPLSSGADLQRGFVAWEPGESFPERNLTLVAASGRIVTGSGRPLPFRIVLAVKTDTHRERLGRRVAGAGVSGL